MKNQQIPHEQLLDHIRGGLYGQALGDAWGAAAYLRPQQTWAYYGGWIETLVAPPPDHPVHHGFRAGQITDDTEQALALVDVFTRDGCITVGGAAEAIVSWYDRIDGDNSPYVGPSTRRGVTALKAGADPHTTGLHGDTNGGAMRVSPIGLMHPGDIGGAIEDAVIACTPTHYTDVALSGACAVAAAVAQALVPGTSLTAIVAAGMEGAEAGVQRGNPWMGPSVTRRIEEAVRIGSRQRQSPINRIHDLYDLIGSTLMTADAVPCAFGVLAMAEGDPVQTAIYAAGLSGDADTVGAMACAIAGAWHGIHAIPQKHVETLRRANPEYDFEKAAQSLQAHIAVAARDRD